MDDRFQERSRPWAPVVAQAARRAGVDAADPAQNVEGAARYLRDQLDHFHDVRLALEAYTRGPEALRAALAADPQAPLPYADAVLAVASAQ